MEEIQRQDREHTLALLAGAFGSITCGNEPTNIQQRPSNRRRRLLSELQNQWTSLAEVPFVSVAPVANDMTDLLGSFAGAPGTPFARGIFFVRIHVPPDYPAVSSPVVRFLTRVYHPNIDTAGHVCADMFGSRGGDDDGDGRSAWSPVWTVQTLLVGLASLLCDPNVDDALRPEVAEQAKNDRPAYDAVARAYTERYATGVRPDIRGVGAGDGDAAQQPWWLSYSASEVHELKATTRMMEQFAISATVGNDSMAILS